MVGICHHFIENTPYILGTADSDIVHATALGTHIIVLNSAKAVHELFEKRSAIYSDRCRICLYVIQAY
jgi:hypothetical protein